MAKIKKEQLDKIVGLQKELEQVLSNIGVLETQKHSLLHKVSDLNLEVEEFKSSLEKEYGAISVDLKTGEYTEIEGEK